MRISTPLQILIIVAFVIVFGAYLPPSFYRASYTISIFIKDLLLMVLPVAVGAYIAATLVSFKRHAILLISVLLVF
jgi:hypothetical protein